MSEQPLYDLRMTFDGADVALMGPRETLEHKARDLADIGMAFVSLAPATVPASKATKHLPGRHSQSRHGGGGEGRMFGSVEEADAALKPAYANWADSLSASEGRSIGLYSAANYRSVNGGLRAGTALDAEDAQIVRDLDSALARTSVPEDVVVFRGVSAAAIPKDVGVGDSFTDPGFVSTSASRQKTEVFVVSAREEGLEPVLMRVAVKKGQPGGYIQGAGRNVRGERYESSPEAEMLLPRDSTFTVAGVSTEQFEAYGETFDVRVVSLDYAP